MGIVSTTGSTAMREQLNFLLTNRIPRRLVTRFMGWFSRVEVPVVRDVSLAMWKLCAKDLNLEEARKTRFDSVHDCFVRELRPGVRPIDRAPEIIVSPCDAIVGASGRVRGTEVIQAKGFPYTLEDLLCDEALVDRYRDGHYVTLRLTSSMYHRFHAPCDCEIEQVIYMSGDTWNVNPIALARVERLFCRNERAIVQVRACRSSESLVLVPVAAILVASIRLNFLEEPLDLKYRGPNRFSCRASFRKGDEMGYFELGSTIIVFAGARMTLCDGVVQGARIRVGEPLFRFPADAVKPSGTR
jgi:phosphatidylserine decarboxylase